MPGLSSHLVELLQKPESSCNVAAEQDWDQQRLPSTEEVNHRTFIEVHEPEEVSWAHLRPPVIWKAEDININPNERPEEPLNKGLQLRKGEYT